MKNLTSLITILLPFSMVLSGPSPRGKVMAVYGLRGINVTEELATSIQEHLESRLISFPGYTIVSRSDMGKILSESAFQGSGACLDESCLINAGHVLGVNQIITGTISKVGDTYNIVLKIIAVQSGSIIASVNRPYQGVVDGLLDTSAACLEELINRTQPVAAVLAAPDTVVRFDTVRTVHTVVQTDTLWLEKQLNATVPDSEPRLPHPVAPVDSAAQHRMAKRLTWGAIATLGGLGLLIVLSSIF